MKCMEGLFSPPPSSHGLRSSSLGVFLAAFSVSALMCRATLWVFSFSFFFLTAECCCEETFFFGGKMEKNGGKKPTQKKVNAHFVNTNTIRESYRSRPFRRRHGTRERDDEGGRVRRDEDDEEEEQNAAVSTQFSDGASSVFFPLLGDVQPRDVEVRCVSLFFCRVSVSLSLSRVFFTRVEEDGRLNDGSSIIDGCTSRRLGDEQGHRNVLEEAKRVVTTRPCDQS